MVTPAKAAGTEIAKRLARMRANFDILKTSPKNYFDLRCGTDCRLADDCLIKFPEEVASYPSTFLGLIRSLSPVNPDSGRPLGINPNFAEHTRNTVFQQNENRVFS